MWGGSTRGSVEGGAGLVVGPGEVPVPVAVGGLHRPVGPRHVHDVTAVCDRVQPAGVLGAHADAAVTDVGAPLGPDRPGRGVQELPGVGHALGVLDVRDVVVVRVVLGHTGGRRVHVLVA